MAGVIPKEDSMTIKDVGEYAYDIENARLVIRSDVGGRKV